MILPILTHPNPMLRKNAATIASVSKEIKALALDMKETMTQAGGIGLAAPQIGTSLRLIIVGDRSPIAMINPVITSRSFRKDVMEEGCLSIPGVLVEVRRSISITVAYTDLWGANTVLQEKGLLARVIQHEIDHLDGILILDKAEN